MTCGVNEDTVRDGEGNVMRVVDPTRVGWKKNTSREVWDCYCDNVSRLFRNVARRRSSFESVLRIDFSRFVSEIVYPTEGVGYVATIKIPKAFRSKAVNERLLFCGLIGKIKRVRLQWTPVSSGGRIRWAVGSDAPRRVPAER